MIKILIVIAGASAALIGSHSLARTASDTPSEIAACVVDNDAADVRVLLKTVPGSPAEAAAARRVLQYYGGCDDNKTSGGRIAWRDRAEIANAALVKRIGNRSPDLTAATQPGWALEIGKDKVAGTDYNSGAVGMRMLGDCVVRAAPQAAVDLARSAPDSAGERTAIGQLSPVLAPCIPAGQNMRVKRADLRLLVAEPLYHLLGK